ncbi:MAG: hypothetical protein CMJ45_01210 [Planctomyces sp.]|nr:hypothetical protein [Planctomyces sp.]
MIDTVIFDLDGTLIDSQPAALGGAIEALARFGVQVIEAELREQFGGGSRKIIQYFLERDLSPGDAARAVDEATALKISLQASYTDRVVLLPNVKQLLQRLKDESFKLALATMAARDVVNAVLDFHGITEHFDVVMTSDDVINVKPDPEILTKTVEALNGSVDASLYVGDSTHDLGAAVSLDMPFLLADTGIFVRGETRTKLRAIAEDNGYPVVGIDELLDIYEVAKSDRS